VSGENVVRILVTSENEASAGFDETAASADEMAAKVSAAADEYTSAMNEAAGAQARLTELQADGSASADDLAAAQDRATAAYVASADAEARLGEAQLEQSMAAKDAGAATDESAASTDAAGASALGFGSKMKLAALGLAAGAAVSIKMAADWQTSLTQLTTSAGEPVKALGALRQGILSLSVGTDTSVSELTSGLYMISSAGFTGAKGLDVLKAAAQGAKSEGASLADVSNVLTSAMNAYNLPASKATATTNELIATVASGKMHLQDLATSLSSVLPIAASAHISLAQVGGAIATMTMQGMSAHRATMDLANMIRSLIDPSATASHEMQAMGLNANTVAKEIGSRGLTGTLSTLTEAILRNSKGGMVMAGDMQKMTPAAQSLSEKILTGSISFLKARTAMQALNPVQEKLVANFQSQAQSATGLKQTFDAAMSKMVGGATGLNVALLIGGKHMDAFERNVKTISDAAKHGGDNISGWSRIQGNFNFKLGQAGKAAEAVAYSLGDALLPAATAVMGKISVFGEWLVRNKAAAIALAAVIVGTLAMVIGGKLVGSLMEAKEAFSALADSEMLQAAASKIAAAGQFLLDAAMDANPIMLVVIALAALAAGFYELWKHCKAFRDFFMDMWRDISRPVIRAFDAIKDAITKGFGAWWKSNGKELEEVWKTAWDVVKTVVRAVWDYISAVIRIEWDVMMAILKPGLALLTTIFRLAWDEIRAVVKTAFDIIAAIVKVAFAAVLMVVKSAWDILVGIFDVALALVTGHWSKAWDDMKTMLTQVWNNIKGFLGAAWHAIADLAEQVWNNIKGYFTSVWHDVAGIFTSGADRIVHIAEDLWHTEVARCKEFWHDVTGIVRDIWHDVTGFFGDLHDDIISITTDLWHREVSGFENIYHGTLTWVERLFHDAVSWFEQLPGRVMAGIAALPGMMLRAGEHAIDSLIDGLTSGIGKIGSVMGGIASKIAGFIGLSPAREGPLSGSGAMFNRGLHIPQDLAAGIDAGRSGLASAASRMAGTVSAGSAGAAGGGSAGGYTELRVTGAGSANWMAVVKAIWPDLKLEVRTVGGGGPYSTQRALGSGVWPKGA
jgi:phage-related protein